MEVNAFAEAVLFGTSLADKLVAPDEFTDTDPSYTGKLPSRPGRAAALAFAPRGARPTFPKVKELDHADGRAETLHFFANHELLALELMALALLKFQDAPTAFRMGIAYTMLEEQTHFQLYRDRIEALGMGFGDRGLNSFFWDTLSGLQTPIDYVCQLSLTFEQANLDFAEHYRDLFVARDDDASAGVMQRIYDDEVGHVGFGVRWFERLRAPGPSMWEAYVDALPHPLSPSRAKGIGFSEAGRRAAGLPDTFIRQLKVFSRSKGSPPRVFCFNPGAPDSDARRDLGVLAAYYAGVSDIAVAARPRLPWLEGLRDAGVELPELIDPAGFHAVVSERRHLRSVHLLERDADGADFVAPFADKLMLKAHADAARLDALVGRDVLSRLAEGIAPPHLAGEESDRLPFTLHIDSASSGQKYRVTRRLELIDGVDAWTLGRPWEGAPEALVRYLHQAPPGDGRPPLRLARNITTRLRKDLRAAGYQGPAAVDFSVRAVDGQHTWTLDGVRLGLSFDGVAAALTPLALNHGPAVWLHFAPAAGAAPPAVLFEQLAAALPAKLLLATNDPEAALGHLTVLYAGPLEPLIEATRRS